MKRIFTFVVSLFAFLSVLGPSPSNSAENLTVRTTARTEFSRVIFEWKRDVVYALDESGKGKIVLRFEDEASPDLSKADFSIFRNTPKPEIVSTKPLVMSFAVTEGVKVRTFDAKGKVYLDVYDRDGAKAPVKEPEKVAAKPKEPEKKADLQKKPEKKIEMALVPEERPKVPAAGKTLPAVPPVAVAAETLDTAEDQKTLQAQAENKQHILTVTSTSSVRSAVYENYGQLVWVIDQDAPHLIPAINGPTPQIFGIFSEEAVPHGMAFAAKMPAGFDVKAYGGGLLWKLVFGKVLQADKPVNFVREEYVPEKSRGGKLIWPVTNAGPIIDIPDPVTGQIIKVVTVNDGEKFAGPARSFVDFDVLHSPIGLAIRAKVDDLTVEKTEKGIVISRPRGLALADEKMIALQSAEAHQAPDAAKEGDDKKEKPGITAPRSAVTKPSIFKFSDWKIGGLDTLNQNKNVILANLHDKDKDRQIEDLMMLAKMHLAHGRGAEALGFLEFALHEMPELEKNKEFLALRGVARAFDWKSEIAFDDLSHPDLRAYDEIAYWRAFVLADLGDWQQAAAILPDDYSYIFDYPEMIADRLALSLAEVNLRAGKVKIAEDLLELVRKNDDSPHGVSLAPAIKYLQGEVARQQGKRDETEKVWGELTQDPDDFYRARAGLALTRLLRDQKKIDNKAAIDRLERLRYAWRGDELEAQINYWLGHAYFESKDYVKGLSIMRDAATIAVDTILGKRIAVEMRDVFANIFLKSRLSDVSAIDSVAMYEQFGDLTPAGEDGNKLVQILAEHLIKAELLERAARLLQNQVDYKLQGADKARLALRLAAVYLMDKQPKRAIRAISTAVKTMDTLPADHPMRALRARDIKLLSARAYAQADMGDKALAILKDMPKDSDVSRLKADIAWQAGYWPDAAEALNDVILNENIPLTRPPTDDQRDLIMNQAIALNLANDRVALANLREKFKDVMVQTTRANQFELITRPRRETELADKDTLMSIMSEVDLFKNFLESYKAEGVAAEEKKPEPVTPAPAPPAAAPPENG